MGVKEKLKVLQDHLFTGDTSVSPAGWAANIPVHLPSSLLSFKCFQPDALGELVDEHLQEKQIGPMVNGGTRDQALLQLCTLIENSTAMDGESGRLYVEGLYVALVARLMHCRSAQTLSSIRYQGGLTGYALGKVYKYMDANLSSDLSLAQLAQTAGMSSYHFARLFQLSTGVSPRQYVIRRRMARAQDLLVESSQSLAEIAHEVGYESQSHFTAVFRKSTGLTPKVFRSRYRH